MPRQAPARPSSSPGREYRRLLAAGVDPRTAYALSALALSGRHQRADDERAYWRQQAARVPTTAAARAAHARAQAARRRARQAA